MGCDPGLAGAIAYVSGGKLEQVYDMPVLELSRNRKSKRELDLRELARMIADGPLPSVAYIEQVGAMPGQGVSSMFAFGKCVGGILGVISTLGITIHSVAPLTWKRFHRIDKNSGKDASRAAAKNLFPPASGLFARVKDDGRAEAALIAAYGAQAERIIK